MTKPAHDADPSWPGFLLAALVAALVILFGAGTASAAAATAAQNRVGAHTLVAQVAVGPGVGIGAGQRLGNDPSAYDSALATGVAAKAGARSLDALSRQGAQLDRNGLTQAGRALQKHANRAGNTAYPKVPGNQLNRSGQDVLDDILTHPQTAERSYVDSTFGPVREFLLPDVGARFEQFGRLIGFL